MYLFIIIIVLKNKIIIALLHSIVIQKIVNFTVYMQQMSTDNYSKATTGTFSFRTMTSTFQEHTWSQLNAHSKHPGPYL